MNQKHISCLRSLVTLRLHPEHTCSCSRRLLPVCTASSTDTVVNREHTTPIDRCPQVWARYRLTSKAYMVSGCLASVCDLTVMSVHTSGSQTIEVNHSILYLLVLTPSWYWLSGFVYDAAGREQLYTEHLEPTSRDWSQ